MLMVRLVFFFCFLVAFVPARAESPDEKKTRCEARAKAVEAARNKKEKTAKDMILALSGSDCDDPEKASPEQVDAYKKKMREWGDCFGKNQGKNVCGPPPEAAF